MVMLDCTEHQTSADQTPETYYCIDDQVNPPILNNGAYIKPLQLYVAYSLTIVVQPEGAYLESFRSNSKKTSSRSVRGGYETIQKSSGFPQKGRSTFR